MRVIVPIDEANFSQASLDTLIGMGWAAGTDIKLISVVEGSKSGGVADAHATATTTLAETARELKSSLDGCELSFVVKEGEPKVEIIALAEEWNADLIVMGSRGNSDVSPCARTVT